MDDYGKPMAAPKQQSPSEALREEFDQRHAAIQEEIFSLQTRIDELVPVRAALAAARDVLMDTPQNKKGVSYA